MATSQYEQELAGFLQERIKPGLNKGAIPLLARSIAKEIARREAEGNGRAEDEPREDGDEPRAEEEEEDVEAGSEDEEDEPRDEDEADEDDAAEDEAEEDDADEDEGDADEDDEDGTQSEASGVDFEAEMHELQSELGEDWILRFSVQGDDAWLTAEKADGSQRVEAPTAEVLTEAVELLNEGGGRTS